ncbi:MAG: RdgB/HAM1 family non-canonical purine NTP pyrophosphatase [Lacisediminihabitans sp.]
MKPGVKLVLATHNAHKVEELRRILGPQLDGIELMGYNGPEPVEDGDTFEANALIKARAASDFTGFPAIGDDSGICVDALNGAPGIYSARYAGTRDDADNYRLLLKNLGDTVDRGATFMCAAALVIPADLVGDACTAPFEHVELGVWPGSIARETAGVGGFGYDPIFVPAGSAVTSAELTAEEKNAISHRSRAFAQLMPVVHHHLA